MAKQKNKSAYSPINHDKPRYNFTGCVTGLCKDLAEEYGVDEVSFRKKNNLYGNAWEIQPYGKKIDISKNYSGLKTGDVINLSRKQLPSDKKNNIPVDKQHIGRISKIVDGVPYVKHFVAVGNDRKYYEEPINNISQFKEYKPVAATRLDSNIDIISGTPKMKFDRSYNPNGVELDVLKGDKSRSELQKKLSVNNEDYDRLSKMAYGVMGAESDYGRSKRSLFRMATPDFIQKGVKVAKDVFNGIDSYDENVNNLSQGYGSIKESSMHGISDSNEKYTKSTGKTAAQRVKSGDYKNLDRTNNYLYNAMTSLGLNADNMENGKNSFKGTFAALATLKKRFPNASDEDLLKKYTGKKDITEYKNKYDSYLKNIDNIKGNDKQYTKTEDVIGSLSQLSNIGNEIIKTGKDHTVSFLRDNIGAPIIIKAMVADMLGAKQPITNKSLSKGENEAMGKIANRVIASNKNATDYQTYFPNLSKENSMAISGGVSGMGVWEKAKKMVSKEGQLQNTLGQSSVVKKGNNVVIKDTYDFNDQGKSFGFFDDISKRSPDPYSIARSLARNFGSADGQGAPVQLTYKNTNSKADGGYINNELNPKYNNYLNMRQYAQGGNLTRFDEGGTHESSRLGGIPQGMSPDGKQNTVEQGESKKGNFVYSNRIELSKDLIKQFNLPGYVANKSVSDASKVIDDKFKHRADKYAQETKNTLLDRLSQAQEYLKQQEQAQLEQTNQSMQANSQQIPDQMNGQIPEGMEEYAEQEPQQGQEVQNIQTPSPIAAFGGYQQHRYSGLDNPNSEMNVVNPNAANTGLGGISGADISGAIGGLYQGAQSAFGKSAVDTSGQAASSHSTLGGGAMKGFQSTAAIGLNPATLAATGGLSALLPVATGIAGLFGAKKDQRAEAKNTSNFALNTNSQFQDQHANGGILGIDPPVKKTRQQIMDAPIIPSANTGNTTSRYVNITGYQPGVVSGSKGAQGSYIYSPELSGGREFVDSSALPELHASPQWNTYNTNMKAQIAAEQASGLPVSSYSNLTQKFSNGGVLGGDPPKKIKNPDGSYSYVNTTTRQVTPGSTGTTIPGTPGSPAVLPSKGGVNATDPGRNKAFAQARAAGLPTFNYNGKVYNTDIKLATLGKPAVNPTPDIVTPSVPPTYETNTTIEPIPSQVYNVQAQRGTAGTGVLRPGVGGGITTNNQYTANKDVADRAINAQQLYNADVNRRYAPVVDDGRSNNSAQIANRNAKAELRRQQLQGTATATEIPTQLGLERKTVSALKQPRTFAYGGNMNQYVRGGGMDEIFKVKENLYPKAIQDLKMDNSATDSSILKQYNNEFLNPNLYSTQKSLDGDRYSLKNRIARVGENVNENIGDAMRLAPVAMNAYQLGKLKKPTGFQYDTLSNRYVPRYVDEAQMQRTIDQEGNNQMAAITQMGGSEGATRNAILGIGANKMRGLSDAYANAAAQNRVQDATAQQFNLGVDAQNIANRNRAIDEMRADQGAYDTAKSKYLASIGTDIGDIGKEKNASDAAIAMFGYTRKGKYVFDKNGNKVSPEELSRRQADFAAYISEQNKKDNK